MSEVKGKQSLRFAKTPFILNSASVVGKKEGEGPLGEYFDVIGMMTNLDVSHGRKQKVPCRRKQQPWHWENLGLRRKKSVIFLQETCWVRL